MGNLKEMNPRWLVGVSILGYGCSLAVGIGVPIPILDEEIALHTSVSDEEIYTQIIDYGADYPKGNTKSLGEVNYAELKSGSIVFNGQETQTVPISSYSRAREIATILKEWIHSGKFLLGQPQRPITSI
jgi:L-aspartate semialdehyde sulfurtransferase